MKGLKAAQGAGEGLKPTYCLTLLSETRRKFPEKRENCQESARQVAKGHAAWPAKGAMKGLKAAQGAGEGLRAAYCLTLLSETRRKSPGKRPAGGQRTCC